MFFHEGKTSKDSTGLVILHKTDRCNCIVFYSILSSQQIVIRCMYTSVLYVIENFTKLAKNFILFTLFLCNFF